jgi:hypothetical protein
MDQGGALQSVLIALATQMMLRKAAQLPVDQGQQDAE